MWARSSIRCTARGRILDGQPSAQRADMPAAPQNKPHTGGVHKGDAREIQRQQFRKAVIYLRIDLPPQRLGGVVVDLAAEVGGKRVPLPGMKVTLAMEGCPLL